MSKITGGICPYRSLLSENQITKPEKSPPKFMPYFLLVWLPCF